MSDCSLSSVSSSVSHSRSYKCGACGGIGHNRRSCSSVSKTVVARKSKEPEPAPKPAPSPPPAKEKPAKAPKAWKGVPDDEEIDLLSFVPIPEPAPKPLPPSPPESVLSKDKPCLSDLDALFRKKCYYGTNSFYVLRQLYFLYPEQFAIGSTGHTSKSETEAHMTLVHTYYVVIRKDGHDVEKEVKGMYHVYYREETTPKGTRNYFTRVSELDSYRKPRIIADFAPKGTL